MEEGRVVIEGRWRPFEGTGQGTTVTGVRMVCLRDRGSCRERLTGAGRGAAEPAPEQGEYVVKEWTSWKLLAKRRTAAGDEVELQVSLKGLAATKSLTRKGRHDAETRWRLE